MVSEIPAFRREFAVEVLRQRHCCTSDRASAVGGVLVPVLDAGAEVFSRGGNPLDTVGPQMSSSMSEHWPCPMPESFTERCPRFTGWAVGYLTWRAKMRATLVILYRHHGLEKIRI